MADFIRPSPNDLIRDGADAISTNADAAADTLGLHAGRLTNLETATGALAGAVSDLNFRTTGVETAINHALPIVASGRPDIPATTPYSSAQLAAMPSGTVYRSTDGPQGAWEWMKRGTEWTPTRVDTGPRDVTALLQPDWEGTVLLTRTDRLVEMTFIGVRPTAGANSHVLTLPVGFRGLRSGSARPVYHQAEGTVTPRRFSIGNAGEVIIQHIVSQVQPIFGQGFWTTKDPWPTVLHGTPA